LFGNITQRLAYIPTIQQGLSEGRERETSLRSRLQQLRDGYASIRSISSWHWPPCNATSSFSMQHRRFRSLLRIPMELQDLVRERIRGSQSMLAGTWVMPIHLNGDDRPPQCGSSAHCSRWSRSTLRHWLLYNGSSAVAANWCMSRL
jgi:hypothetical protein